MPVFAKVSKFWAHKSNGTLSVLHNSRVFRTEYCLFSCSLQLINTIYSKKPEVFDVEFRKNEMFGYVLKHRKKFSEFDNSTTKANEFLFSSLMYWPHDYLQNGITFSLAKKIT